MFRCLLLLAAIFATVSAFGPASLLRSVRPAAGLSEFRDVFTPA
jgi:hypothetical protein